MWQVNEAFERDYDQRDCEAKIGAIAAKPVSTQRLSMDAWTYGEKPKQY